MANIFDNIVEVAKKTPFLSKALELFPVIGPVVGTGLQFLFDTIAANKQRKIARDLANQQNEYNSPVEQMRRYREAGMNPAYGSANFNNQAVNFSNAAYEVARPVVPDTTQILRNMEDYQNFRNAKIQGEVLRTKVMEGLTKANFLNDSYDERLSAIGLGNLNSQARYDSTVSNLVADIALKNLKGILMNQDIDFKSKSNPLNLRILELAKELNESGLNSSDDSFVRVLLRKIAGNKTASDLFPYVIGDRVASFAGDLLKIGIPSGALKNAFGGRYNNPSYEPSRYFKNR